MLTLAAANVGEQRKPTRATCMNKISQANFRISRGHPDPVPDVIPYLEADVKVIPL